MSLKVLHRHLEPLFIPPRLRCPSPAHECLDLIAGTETLQEGTSVGTPVTSVTLENVTFLRNATTTLVRDQDSVKLGNQNAYGTIAAAGMMNRSSHPWGQGSYA